MNPLPSTAPAADPVLRRMTALGIREEDLEETFVRSGGRGGQNVNKTSTCVQLLHRPTGLQVKCQASRQQGQNRDLARRLLLEKIASQRRLAAAAAEAERERLRRQKRPRSRAAKERILAAKSIQSRQKVARRRAGPDD